MRCMPGITKRLGKVILLMANGSNKGDGSNGIITRWNEYSTLAWLGLVCAIRMIHKCGWSPSGGCAFQESRVMAITWEVIGDVAITTSASFPFHIRRLLVISQGHEA